MPGEPKEDTIAANGQGNPLSRLGNDMRLLRRCSCVAAVILGSVTAARRPVLGAAEPIKTLTGHRAWVASVAFHPGGRLVAAGGHDGTARLRDVAAGKETWAFDYRSHVTSRSWQARLGPG